MSTKSDRIFVGQKVFARPLLILSAKKMQRKRKRKEKTILNYADDTGEKNETTLHESERSDDPPTDTEPANQRECNNTIAK